MDFCPKNAFFQQEKHICECAEEEQMKSRLKIEMMKRKVRNSD